MSQKKLAKVKHDLFIKCAAVEDVTFWKKIFEACAYGQFPKGMTYKSNTIYYKKGKKKTSIAKPIPENAEDAVNVVKTLFRSEIGLISIDEYTKSQIESRKKLESISLAKDARWKDIRAPTTQMQMIYLYVSAQVTQLGLSRFEGEQLLSCVVLGILTERITSDDITLDTNIGRIHNIDHLYRGAYGFFIDKPIIAAPYKPIKYDNTVNQKPIGENWGKIVESYNKQAKTKGI